MTQLRRLTPTICAFHLGFSLDTFGEQFQLMREFTLPDKPFSSFVSEYIRDRFPLMADFLK